MLPLHLRRSTGERWVRFAAMVGAYTFTKARATSAKLGGQRCCRANTAKGWSIRIKHLQQLPAEI